MKRILILFFLFIALISFSAPKTVYQINGCYGNVNLQSPGGSVNIAPDPITGLINLEATAAVAPDLSCRAAAAMLNDGTDVFDGKTFVEKLNKADFLFGKLPGKPDFYPSAIAYVQGLQEALDAKINDAPADGKIYGRQNNAWEEVQGGGPSSASWGAITGDINKQQDLQKEFANYELKTDLDTDIAKNPTVKAKTDKNYVDAQDATTLQSAKKYTDDKVITSLWGYPVPEPKAENDGQVLAFDSKNKTWKYVDNSGGSSTPSIAGILVNGAGLIQAKKPGDIIGLNSTKPIYLESNSKDDTILIKYINNEENK